MTPDRRERVWTAAVLSVALFGIALYCLIVSRYRTLWSDELFGWELVNDPSWRHMLRAWQLGADGGGISFYVLCRLWVRVLGHSKIIFRGFSATNVFVAFATMWALLRRYYQPWIAAVSLFLVWLGSRVILWQVVQTRFYGLLLAAAALTFFVWLPEASDALQSNRTRQALLVFGTNFLLVSTHPLGAGYSFVLLGAFLVADASHRRYRPWLYGAAACSWVVLFFSRTAMENSAAVGKPWFWTVRPTLLDLEAMYEPTFLPMLPWLVLLALALTLLWPKGRRNVVNAAQQRRDVLLPGLLLALTPVALWVVSQRGTSYFVDRYMIPFTLGIAVLAAEAFTQFAPQKLSWKRPFPLVLAMAAVLLYMSGADGLFQYPREMVVPPLDFTQQLTNMLPRGKPIIFVRVDIFDLMVHYHNTPDLPMYYPVDWGVATAPGSPHGMVSGVNEMRNWRKAGYNASHIIDSDSFLEHAQDFIVVDGAAIPWMAMRLENKPEWKLTRLEDFQAGPWSETIWRVTRQPKGMVQVGSSTAYTPAP